MATKTCGLNSITLDDGTVLLKHDGSCEWYDCGDCGYHIDPCNEVEVAGQDEDSTACPKCGSVNTAWMIPARRGHGD